MQKCHRFPSSKLNQKKGNSIGLQIECKYFSDENDKISRFKRRRTGKVIYWQKKLTGFFEIAYCYRALLQRKFSLTLEIKLMEFSPPEEFHYKVLD